MRLFVAAELPGELVEALAETSASLRDGLHGRYVPPDSLHVTLAFLGEVPASAVPTACEALDEACLGAPAIRVTLGAFGTFGRAGRSTLWQGFARGVDELGTLAGDVRECLAEHGLGYDSKAFAPHVTLMRGLDLTHGELPSPVVASGTITSVALFSSDLSCAHPRYEALHRVALDEPTYGDDGQVGGAASRGEVDYPLLASQLRALADGETSLVAVLSNATALVAEALPDVSWVGFYLRDDADDLVLGPFQGKVACMRIGWGRGVCGTAAASGQTQLVPDVHAFAGHIACDSASQSEVVVPIWHDRRVWGVLDLDSTSPARFDERDAWGLGLVVGVLEELLGSLR